MEQAREMGLEIWRGTVFICQKVAVSGMWDGSGGGEADEGGEDAWVVGGGEWTMPRYTWRHGRRCGRLKSEAASVIADRSTSTAVTKQPRGRIQRTGREAMAVTSTTTELESRRSERDSWCPMNFLRNRKAAFALALLLADAVLVSFIIAYVPYTKIDWDAYMSQVSGFLGGERDYGNLKGDTGPLVYPAGFLYVYSAIQFVTGGEVYLAQILFGVLYILNLGIVFFIYVKTDVLPWWALCLLCLSKRVHSIFVLRLFNDCFATMLLHAAMAVLLSQKWHVGLIIFSAAVSIKMNVLLYAPPLLLLMLKAMDIFEVVSALACAAVVQILLGLPFLLSYPVAYISRAFNLGRIFIHFWSVNFKFVPEPVFVSKGFAVSLLVVHLALLFTFAHYRWCKHEGGLLSFLYSKLLFLKLKFSLSSSFSQRNSHTIGSSSKVISQEHIVTTMFVGNFIGIVCARSLHYQFYSWYFYSLPYLLWRTPFPTLLRIILFVGVEVCWNIYPSNNISSVLLLCLHLIILWGLWCAPPEYPYVKVESSSRNKEE